MLPIEEENPGVWDVSTPPLAVSHGPTGNTSITAPPIMVGGNMSAVEKARAAIAKAKK